MMDKIEILKYIGSNFSSKDIKYIMKLLPKILKIVEWNEEQLDKIKDYYFEKRGK